MRLIQLAATVMTVAFTAGLGLGQRPGEFGRALRDRRTLARGLALHLVLVPLLTLACVRGLGLRDWRGNALLLLAVCPGAPFSARGARRLGGSVPLAEVLTLGLGALTALTAAPSARLLIGYAGPLAHDPRATLAKLLALQWLPLLLGLSVARTSPRWAGRLGKLTAALFGAGLLLVLGALLGTRLPTLVALGWPAGLAALALLGLALALAGALGGGGQAGRTLAATAALPNVGLALLLVSGARAAPELPLALVAVFLLRALAFWVLLGAAALARRRRAAAA